MSPYIPGRLSSLGYNSGGSGKNYSADSDSPLVHRFYNKPQEITATSDNLSGFLNRLNVHDNITPGRKRQQNARLLWPYTSFSKYHTAKASKFTRPVRVFKNRHLQAPLHLQSDLIRGLQMNQ